MSDICEMDVEVAKSLRAFKAVKYSDTSIPCGRAADSALAANGYIIDMINTLTEQEYGTVRHQRLQCLQLEAFTLYRKLKYALSELANDPTVKNNRFF